MEPTGISGPGSLSEWQTASQRRCVDQLTCKLLVLCIVSMIRYVSSIHWSDTRYVSRYVYRGCNIEAGIEHVCNISNMNFQKFPLARYFLLQIIWLVQCRDSWDILWQSPKSKNWSNSNRKHSAPKSKTNFAKVMTVTSQCYPKMESQRIEFTFEQYPLLNMGTLYTIEATISLTRPRQARIAPRLGCHSTHSLRVTQTQSASSSALAIFQLPRFFSRVVCNWAARGTLLETLLALFFIFTACFWSYFAVIAHMRKSVLERW